jgi:hypothetical protein
MNFNINLDSIKPLLKASVDKLDFGIGFSLYYYIIYVIMNKNATT